MQAVENRTLVEEVALGRVHVLPAKRIVVAQLPRLKPEHAPARVGEREHQSLWEVVGAARGYEACGLELVEREAAFLRFLGEPFARREAESERLRDVLAEPAAREVLAHRRTSLPLPEQALEVCGRLIEHGVEALAATAFRVDPRRCLLHLDRDTKAIGEPLDRPHEVEVLGLADERRRCRRPSRSRSSRRACRQDSRRTTVSSPRGTDSGP